MHATVEARQHPTYRYRTAYWGTIMNDKAQPIFQIGPYRNRKDALAAAQLRIDGTAPDVGGMLQRQATAPLKPRKPQAPCDVGLFSDDADQLDLVSLFRDR